MRAIAILFLSLLAACGDDSGAAVATTPDATALDAMAEDDIAAMMMPDAADPPPLVEPMVMLPPENAGFDYQLGGAYPPPAGITIVARDRTEAIAAGVYNICYVNGFQVQPGEDALWDEDLILRDDAGDPVIDEDWDEALLDTRTEDKRARIAEQLGKFIDGCGLKGFDAIEVDNLDSYSRSGGRLTQDGAVALMALLSEHAHGLVLAIAQKNSTELLERRSEMGTDFAVAEECSAYDECGEYVEAYGPGVLMIEYSDEDFEKGCADYGATHPIVRRDLDLTTPDDGAYVFDDC
jgi:hypothetical protein